MTFPVLGSRARLLSWAATAMIVVGACSSAATPVPATPAPATPAPATAAPATPAPATSAPATATASPTEAAGSPETYTLTVVTGAGSLGKYLTGEDGMTLYIFKKDTPGDGKSACSGGCLDAWPPLSLSDDDKVVAGAGATGTIATITGTNGKKQVTYNGAPLYYFAADEKAGDTKGEGVNDVWFVAAP